MSKDQEPKRYPPKKDYTPEVTSADLTATINKSLETLLTDLEAGKTARLLSYLAFSSRFHRYSPRNQQLIFEHRPDATRVASYQTWKQEGYQVAKGEKGIRILVPTFPKGYKKLKEEDPDQADPIADAQTRRQQEASFVTHNFTVGSVFDVSQLTPEKRPPEFFTPIEGDYAATYQRLKRAAEADGIKVYESYEHLSGARALSGIGVIIVRPDLTPGSKAHFMAHEYGHERIHTPELRRSLPKETKEGHAEAVAYVVSTHLGIPTPDSADYLTMWGNNAESLRRELHVVTTAASHIIQKVHSLNPGEAHFHDQTEQDSM